jgi:hypothetical protein
MQRALGSANSQRARLQRDLCHAREQIIALRRQLAVLHSQAKLFAKLRQELLSLDPAFANRPW